MSVLGCVRYSVAQKIDKDYLPSQQIYATVNAVQVMIEKH